MKCLISIDNKDVEVNIFSSKPTTIILLSGWTHDFVNETKFIEELARKYRVIIISYPGYLGSEENSKSQSMYFIAKIIDSVVKTLKLKRFKVLGFSMGCQAALHYKNKYNKDADLILISPILYSLLDETPYYGRLILSSNLIISFIRKFRIFKLFAVKEAYKKVYIVTEGQYSKAKFNEGKVSLNGAFDTLIAAITSFIDPFSMSKNTKFIFGEKEILQNKLGKNIKYDIIPTIGHGEFDKMYKEIVDTIN